MLWMQAAGPCGDARAGALPAREKRGSVDVWQAASEWAGSKQHLRTAIKHRARIDVGLETSKNNAGPHTVASRRPPAANEVRRGEDALLPQPGSEMPRPTHSDRAWVDGWKAAAEKRRMRSMASVIAVVWVGMGNIAPANAW